jgi:hypothetical protein
MTLPTGAPVSVGYAAGATSFAFTSDAAKAGQYVIEARSGAVTKSANVTLPSAPVNFTFP